MVCQRQVGCLQASTHICSPTSMTRTLTWIMVTRHVEEVHEVRSFLTRLRAWLDACSTVQMLVMAAAAAYSSVPSSAFLLADLRLPRSNNITVLDLHLRDPSNSRSEPTSGPGGHERPPAAHRGVTA